MSKMKYIVMDLDGEETPIIFPSNLVHKDVVESIRLTRVDHGGHRGWSRPYRTSECLSAGFVSYSLECHGKSESLNIDSRPGTDTNLLKEHFCGMR